MVKTENAARERKITRAIHRLFWQANLVEAKRLFVCYLMRIPAQIIYHALIPVQIAYGVEAIVSGQFERVDEYAFAIVLLAVAYGIFWAIGGYTVNKAGAKAGAFLQKAVFANYLQKDYDFYSNTYLGALGAQAARLRDALSTYNIVVVRDLPRLVVIILAGIIVIGLTSPLLALVTLVSMSFVLSFTIWSGKWRLRYRRQLSEASSELSGVVGDALGHGVTVKSHAAEDYESERLEGTLKGWIRAQVASWNSAVPSDVGRSLLAAITTAILLILTARLYQAGDISIAIVALVQLYVIKMISATNEIADILKTYETAIGDAYQPVSTMLIEPTVLDKEHPRSIPKKADLAIQFNSVAYHYPDAKKGRLAVKDFSLTIAAGQRIGIVGFSGSGKTTLTKLLLRFMDISAGSILLSGIDIRDLSQRELREYIAYVPQEPLLFHRTIAENIGYGKPSASNKKVREAATMAYVDEFAKDLPKAYDTLVGERGVKLSGGQRQRVAIARALLKDAPILVLDEATSALDSQSERLIQQALWKLMKGRTALVIAHRLSTIQHMDKIVVMDKGKIVQVGTHEELLKQKDGIYATLWSHQSGGYIGAKPATSSPPNKTT